MNRVLVENVEKYGDPVKRDVCRGLEALNFQTVSFGRKVDYCDYWEKVKSVEQNNVKVTHEQILYDIRGSQRRYPEKSQEELIESYRKVLDSVFELLTSQEFKFVVIWGGLLQSSRAIKRVCDVLKIECYATEYSFDKGRIYFDKCGIIGNQHEFSKKQVSLPFSEKDKGRMLEWVKVCEHTKASFPRSKVEDLIRAQKFCSDSKVNVLLIGQCNIDTVITYDLPDFEDTFSAYEAVAKEVKKLPNVNLVAKLHPGDKVEYKERIKSLLSEGYGYEVIDDDTNTYSLMSVFDKAITINSQAGLEMLMHKKNVLTLGDSFYSNNNLGLNLASFNNLECAIAALVSSDISDADYSEILSYTHNYLYNYLIDRDVNVASGIAKKIGYYGQRRRAESLVIVHPSACDHGSAFYLQELSEKLKQQGIEVLIISEGACPLNWNGVQWLRLKFRGKLLSREIKRVVTEFSPSYIMQVGVRTRTMRAALELKVLTNAELIVQAEDDEDAVFEKYYPKANLEILRVLDKPELNKNDFRSFLSLVDMEHSLKVFSDPEFDRWVEPTLRILCYKLSSLHCSIWDDMADRLYDRYRKPSFIIPPVISVDEYETINRNNFDKQKLLEKYNVRADTFLIFINGSIYPYSDEFEVFVQAVKEFKIGAGVGVTLMISGRAPANLKAYAQANLKGSVYFRNLKSPSDEDYNNLIKASDIICAPGYNDDFNKYRMSSRLVKAIALNKPIFTYKTGFASKLKSLEHGYFTSSNSKNEWVFLLMCAFLNKESDEITYNARKLLIDKFCSKNIASRLANLLKSMSSNTGKNSSALLNERYAEKFSTYTKAMSHSDDSSLTSHPTYKKVISHGLFNVSADEFFSLFESLAQTDNLRQLEVVIKVFEFVYRDDRKLRVKLIDLIFKLKLWALCSELIESIFASFTDSSNDCALLRRLSICSRHLGDLKSAIEFGAKALASNKKADIDNMISLLYHIDEKSIRIDLESFGIDRQKFVETQILNANNTHHYNKFVRALAESIGIEQSLISNYHNNAYSSCSSTKEALEFRNLEWVKQNDQSTYSAIKKGFGDFFVAHESATLNELDTKNLVVFKDDKLIPMEEYKGDICVVYLPHVFYSLVSTAQKASGQERFSNDTKRGVLMLIEYLVRSTDSAIIFKHQFHNSKIDARNHTSRFRRVFSHHTKSIGQVSNASHYHYKQSPFPGYMMLDKQGYSGWSKASEISRAELQNVDTHSAETFFEQLVNQFVNFRQSKYTQKDSAFNVSKPFVFCAMQLLDDSVAKLAKFNSLDMVKLTVDALKDSDYNVVIKRHPFCKNEEVGKVLKRLENEKHVIVTDASIHKIFPNASGVITVNSGVGLEAFLYGKKVFVTGTAEYNSVATQLFTEDAFAGLPAALKTQEPDLHKQFLYKYFSEYLFNLTKNYEQLSKFITLQ